MIYAREMTADRPSIKLVTVIDDLSLQAQIAIEVEITLSDGSRRWCFFCNNKSMDRFGDWCSGTQIPVHNAPHMFVVGGPITIDLIEAVLNEVDQQGDLFGCTRALE